MADGETLSQRPTAGTGTEDDLYWVEQAVQSRKQTRTQLRAAIVSGWQTFIGTFLAASTPSAARSILGAAASGANADITSITGSAASLTTSRNISATGDATWTVGFNGAANATAAITLASSGVSAGTYGSVTVNAKGLVTSASAVTPVANGGTARNTVALFLGDLQTAGAYGKTNILGTVSQSAGVPTGSVIERGSNANGEYVKYADGTLICTGTIATFAMGATTSTGQAIALPATFINTNYAVSIFGTPGTSADVYGFTQVGTKTTTSFVGTYRNGATAQNITNTAWSAIGRWL